jgi:hypothetical protein
VHYFKIAEIFFHPDINVIGDLIAQQIRVTSNFDNVYLMGIKDFFNRGEVISIVSEHQ